jgi:hypothetical protein
LLALIFTISLPAWGQDSGGDFSTNLNPTAKEKVPEGVIIVKGAWASASDSVTPLPEGGTVANGVFKDPYFGMTYPLPTDWTQRRTGPPPSESGLYVLAQIAPGATFKGPARATILVTAQDMFFTQLPVNNALELVNYTKDNLQADYKLEMKPTETTVAGRSFTFFAYWSPVAELHWYVLATQIRCHTVELVLTSRDTQFLQSLSLEMNKMKLPLDAGLAAGKGGGEFPICIKDYARGANVIERVDPVFTERRFNAVPVRIVIDKEGKVKHIHYLSAFPEQAKAITDALMQWRFRPYLREGKPVEVETGIMFGRGRPPAARTANSAQD